MDDAVANLRLAAPELEHASVVTSWSVTPEETRLWCSRDDHPLSADVVTGWWRVDQVRPWLLLSATGAPVAYGELWLDPDADEVELARIIVAPDWRHRGVGRRIVRELSGVASQSGLRHLYLRVDPRNGAAIRCYRAAGFIDVDPSLAIEWNHRQPARYRWFRRPEND